MKEFFKDILFIFKLSDFQPGDKIPYNIKFTNTIRDIWIKYKISGLERRTNKL